jgi:hypothetical protein
MDEVFDPLLVEISHIKQKWLYLSYADYSEVQLLDIYLPDVGNWPFPMIVSRHGEGLVKIASPMMYK